MSVFQTYLGKIQWIRILSFGALAIFTIAVIINSSLQTNLLSSIHIVLNYEPLYKILIAISFLLGAFYSYYFLKIKTDQSLLLFKVFGPLFDPPANTLTYGAILASVLRMLRGLFGQIFYQEAYFKDFGFIDITSITLTCLVLLVWSVTGLVRYVVFVFVKPTTSLAKVEPPTAENES